MWRAGLARRWQELREGPWSEVAILAAVDAKRRELTPAALRTLARWSEELSQVLFMWDASCPAGPSSISDYMQQMQTHGAFGMCRRVYVGVWEGVHAHACRLTRGMCISPCDAPATFCTATKSVQ